MKAKFIESHAFTESLADFFSDEYYERFQRELLDVYGKNEKDDLAAGEKKILGQLANELKQQAKLMTSGSKETRS